MKTNRNYYPLALAAALQLVVNVSVAQSEWKNPEDWKTLVKAQESGHNTYFKDTLLIQGFDENESSIVDFEVSGKYDFFYPIDSGIKGASESKAIRLYPGSSLTLTWDKTLYNGFSTVGRFCVPFAAQNVNIGESISFEAISDDEEELTTVYEVSTNSFSIPFNGKLHKFNGFWYPNKIYLKETTISIKEGETPSNGGYYCIDSIFVTGFLPTYTLIQQGDWHTPASWSHNCPTPKRVALVNGEITVKKAATCQSIMTYDADIHFADYGALRTSEMTSIYTFPEKGKWYFLSFPFDVYPEGVDEDFEWGDASTDTSSKAANVFYVREYDGVARSGNGEAESNWRILSPGSSDASQPIFHKGKGYLVAIDETSDTSTLSFTSSGETLEYSTETRIPIEADEAQAGDEADNGWFLCGNPYPSSLSLREIQPNPDLDGNIYLYNGSEYEAYAIGSDYTLPPHAAFFVKAKGDTELTIHKEATEARHWIRSSVLSSQALCQGPATEKELPMPDFTYRIEGNELVFPALASSGQVAIYNMYGKLLRRVSLLPGHARVALPASNGIYLIHIQTGKQVQVIKWRRHF